MSYELFFLHGVFYLLFPSHPERPSRLVIQTTERRKDLVDTHVDVIEIFRTESSTTRLRFALNDTLC